MGIDGAGKTTCLNRISEYMQQQKQSYISLERKLFQEHVREFQIPTYVENYMKTLGIMLWGATPQDPVTELSDEVWLYMHAIWYDVFQQYVLTTAIAKYDYVLLDSWYYKIMARFLVNQKYQIDMFEGLFA